MSMENPNILRRFAVIFWVFWLVFRRHFLLATSTILIALILSLEPVVSLYVFGKMVDLTIGYVGGTVSFREVGLIYALQGGLFVMQRIITPLKDWLQGILSNHLLNDLTMDLMEKTSKIPYIFLESTEIYNDLEMANGAKDRLHQIFIGIVNLGSSLVMFASMFWLLSQLSLWIAIGVVATLVPYIFLDQRAAKQGWQLMQELSILRRKMGFLGGVWSNRTACRELRMWDTKDWLFGKYSQVFRTWFTAERRQGFRRMNYLISGGLFMAAGFVLVLFMTLRAVEAGAVTVGMIAMYIQAVTRTQSTAYMVFAGVSSLFEHSLYILSIRKILNMEVPDEEKESGISKTPSLMKIGALPSIVFEDVSFKYPGADKFAVKNLNLTLQSGKMTALVGENGAGKSTIAKLSIGLYPPTEGWILIDGVLLDSSNTSEWFKQTRVLFQDASQYALTLAENVLLGRGTEADAIRALDEAGFATSDEIDTDFLAQVLSKEFGGTELSGGHAVAIDKYPLTRFKEGAGLAEHSGRSLYCHRKFGL